jgi:hypothetical protein
MGIFNPEDKNYKSLSELIIENTNQTHKQKI